MISDASTKTPASNTLRRDGLTPWPILANRYAKALPIGVALSFLIALFQNHPRVLLYVMFLIPFALVAAAVAFWCQWTPHTLAKKVSHLAVSLATTFLSRVK